VTSLSAVRPRWFRRLLPPRARPARLWSRAAVTRVRVLLGYVAALAVAEALLAVSVPAAAIGLGLVALVLLHPLGVDPDGPSAHLVPVLLAVPVVRLVLIGAPGADVPPALRAAALAVPVAVAVALAGAGRPAEWRLWRPGPSGWWAQARVALVGLPLGLVAAVLAPSTVASGAGLPPGVVAALLVVAVVPDELLHRGLFVPATVSAVGRVGVPLAAAVSASAFVGHGPLPLLAAFVTGLSLAWLRQRTGSAVGVVAARVVLVLTAVFLLSIMNG
jgi:hypothetical protein